MVNVVAILVGGGIGLLLKRFTLQRLMDAAMQGVGLAVVVIGISKTLAASYVVVAEGLQAQHTLLLIISLALGALLGEFLAIDAGLSRFAAWCETSFIKPGTSSTFAEGFVTATLMFCVGSMAIVGALEDGINQNSEVLFAKSTLDFIASMILASTLGAGVLLSAAAVAIYQGGISLLAVFLAPHLSDIVIAQISMVGSVLIMGIGLNILGISKLKIGNLLPAVFLPVIYYAIRLLF